MKLKFPKPSKILLPPKPPLPPFTPPVIKKNVEAVSNFLTAPIKSTIAADPLLSWVETGKLASFHNRTKAGVHELYKEDRLAQRLGVKESSVVTVVEIAAVCVAIYFGCSFAASALSGAGSASAGAGAASAGAASSGGGISFAGVTAAAGTASEVIGAGGAVAAVVAPKSNTGSEQEIGGEFVPDAGGKNATPFVLGAGALLALLIF